MTWQTYYLPCKLNKNKETKQIQKEKKDKTKRLLSVSQEIAYNDLLHNFTLRTLKKKG